MVGHVNMESNVADQWRLSCGEARRLAEQGGFSIDVDLPFITVLGDRNAVLLRAGKKRFLRVMMP